MGAPEGISAGLHVGTAPWKSAIRTVVTVDNTATALPTTALVNRSGLWIFNGSSSSLFIAPTTAVSSSNEGIVTPRASILIPATDEVIIYGILASGSASIAVWEFRVA